MPLEKQGARLRTVVTSEDEAADLEALLASLSPEELELVRRALEGEEEALQQINELEHQVYVHGPPLAIEDWLADPYYCGEDGAKLYAPLKKTLIDCFNGNYTELVCTGGVGWGKSTLAAMLARYLMYYLSCFRDPGAAHGLGPGSLITFALFSTRLKQLRQNLWLKLKLGVENTPYFKENCTVRWPRTGNEAFIGNHIQIIAAPPDSEAAIGSDLFFAIMDEVNFGRNAATIEVSGGLNATADLMTMGEKIYMSLIKRIQSRFQFRGRTMGKIVVISSKNDDSDLTQKRVLAAKTNPTIMVLDYLAHEIKPSGNYTGKKFRLFFGGRYLKSRILEDDEPVPQGHDDDDTIAVLELPLELKQAFAEDMVRALRDLAGVAVPNVTHYFSDHTKIQGIFADRDDEHPFYGEEWICGDERNVRWDKLCQFSYERVSAGVIDKVWKPRVNPDAPRHVHLDLSKKRDATGLAIGHIHSMVEVSYFDFDTKKITKEIRPFIWIDLVLAIRPQHGGVIVYDDIRNLLYSIKNHGFNISYLTADSYQSHDLITTIRKKLCPAEEFSLDKSMVGYDLFLAAVHQGRLSCYHYPKLERELQRLQYDARALKVDHPQGEGESKDVSDAVAGVIASLTRLRSSAAPLIPAGALAASKNVITSPMDVFYDVQTGKRAPQSGQGQPWWGQAQGLPFIKG